MRAASETLIANGTVSIIGRPFTFTGTRPARDRPCERPWALCKLRVQVVHTEHSASGSIFAIGEQRVVVAYRTLLEADEQWRSEVSVSGRRTDTRRTRPGSGPLPFINERETDAEGARCYPVRHSAWRLLGSADVHIGNRQLTGYSSK